MCQQWLGENSVRKRQTCYDHDMTELSLTTFDWVPELPRGYVRDLRVRWALKEAGLPIASKVSRSGIETRHALARPRYVRRLDLLRLAAPTLSIALGPCGRAERSRPRSGCEGNPRVKDDCMS
jgi:hypothetical protein